MDHIDLVERLVPAPSHTLVVETPAGEIVLVDTERPPAPGDTVLSDEAFSAYMPGLSISGVVYCLIRFL